MKQTIILEDIIEIVHNYMDSIMHFYQSIKEAHSVGNIFPNLT